METEQYLPIELIIQILLRLPVKSLIRFKCVCKSWFSLISHSDFTNSHFQLTSAAHIRRIQLITPYFVSLSIDIESSLSDDNACYSPDISFLIDDDDYYSSSSSDLDDLSPPKSFFKLDFKGSCRGFILLNCYSSLRIWNPSTGFHKRIPFTTIDCNPDANYFYGFGYDESRDDYLVLSMSYESTPSSDGNLSHLGIFSLRANVWSEIEGGKLLPYSQDSILNLVESLSNGAIHWLAYRDDISIRVIVAFHLVERKLLELRLPNDVVYGPSSVYELWVYKGCLALWDLSSDKGAVEIWVMEKYNVQSSWTKTLVLSFDGLPTRCFWPKYYTKSGDIVGTNMHSLLAKYNDKGQLQERRSYCDNEYGSLKVMYTESLLSIPGGDSGQV